LYRDLSLVINPHGTRRAGHKSIIGRTSFQSVSQDHSSFVSEESSAKITKGRTDTPSKTSISGIQNNVSHKTGADPSKSSTKNDRKELTMKLGSNFLDDNPFLKMNSDVHRNVDASVAKAKEKVKRLYKDAQATVKGMIDEAAKQSKEAKERSDALLSGASSGHGEDGDEEEEYQNSFGDGNWDKDEDGEEEYEGSYQPDVNVVLNRGISHDFDIVIRATIKDNV